MKKFCTELFATQATGESEEVLYRALCHTGESEEVLYRALCHTGESEEVLYGALCHTGESEEVLYGALCHTGESEEVLYRALCHTGHRGKGRSFVRSSLPHRPQGKVKKFCTELFATQTAANSVTGESEEVLYRALCNTGSS